MDDIFCTYFDSGYLTRGLALCRSLERSGRPFHLWVLCLDEPCHRTLARLKNPHMRLVSLPELQAADPDYAQARHDRSRVEYYFTSTPVFFAYVLARSPRGAMVTYLDADLFFFGSPTPLFAALAAASCGLVEHRFPAQLAALTSRGLYNVGWVSLRHDRTGLDCAAWWRDRCLEWCYDRVEAERFADQKYLDLVPKKFSAVATLHHPGANLAPWNLGRHSVSIVEGRPLVDGQPLIFFHFHGLRQIARRTFTANFAHFLHKPDPAMIEHVYRPYLRALAEETAGVSDLIQLPQKPRSWGRGRGAYLAVRDVASPSFALGVLRGRTVVFYRGAPVWRRRAARSRRPGRIAVEVPRSAMAPET